MRIIIAFAFLTFSQFHDLSAQTNPNHVYVSGYHRADGTYVPAHYRTAPNHTAWDNFSTIGNVNPYTMETGTVVPSESSTRSPIESSWRNLENDYSLMPLYVARSKANVRRMDNVDSDLLLTIQKGDVVRLVAHGHPWLQVSVLVNGGYIVGFVHENVLRRKS